MPGQPGGERDRKQVIPNDRAELAANRAVCTAADTAGLSSAFALAKRVPMGYNGYIETYVRRRDHDPYLYHSMRSAQGRCRRTQSGQRRDLFSHARHPLPRLPQTWEQDALLAVPVRWDAAQRLPHALRPTRAACP